jgi:hypothetical protein
MSEAATNNFVKGEFKPLPDGDYLMRLTELTEKKTKNGDDMLTGKFQVVKGPEGVEGAKNRIVFENFVLTHSNSKVVDITMTKLNKLAQATGIDATIEGGNVDLINDALEMPFIATLGEGKPYNGKINNVIKAYKAK